MPPAVTPTARIHPENYRYLQDVVYSGSGIVLEQDKHYLFETRLTSVARKHGLNSINDLCALIRGVNNAGVQSEVVEAMTTNETYFFREPAQYEAIRTVLLPELRLLRGDKARRISCWSAASSTGQEAYSLAMMLHNENFGDWNIQILGTDLSNQVLEKARAARYLQIEVNRGLQTSMLLKYFDQVGLDWQLKQPVKKGVRFEHFDLRTPVRAFGPFDLVFCRNVLVYFDLAARTKILREIHRSLFRGGWLLMGTAESPTGLEDIFERRNIGTAVVFMAR